MPVGRVIPAGTGAAPLLPWTTGRLRSPRGGGNHGVES